MESSSTESAIKFGYDSNDKIIRVLSIAHTESISLKDGKDLGIEDIPNRGLTLINQKGLIKAAMNCMKEDGKHSFYKFGFRN